MGGRGSEKCQKSVTYYLNGPYIIQDYVCKNYLIGLPPDLKITLCSDNNAGLNTVSWFWY